MVRQSALAKVSRWLRFARQIVAIAGETGFYAMMLRGDHKRGALAQCRSHVVRVAGEQRDLAAFSGVLVPVIGVLVIGLGLGAAGLRAETVTGMATGAIAPPADALTNLPDTPMAIAASVAIADAPDESHKQVVSDPAGDATASLVALPQVRAERPLLRPRARKEALPQARWSHRPEAALWTRSALAALGDHGQPLVTMVPGDILDWCPAYPQASHDQRAAFWVGFISALTKHESTYKPHAVGGGGLWYGLMQILPPTARLYKCRARSGAALKNGSANLSCAIRIMARTVPRDGVIHAYTKSYKRRWRGVTADWGPMRSSTKRRDMARWLKAQSYCQPLSSKRPRIRPEGIAIKREG